MKRRKFNKDACSACGISFKGPEVPEQYRGDGGATHYSLYISMYDMYKDMTVRYACPDCGAQWDRFTGEPA